MEHTTAPRIALIHALEESVLPARRAFKSAWPEAQAFDLLDTSLAVDLSNKGKLDQAIIDRFLALGQYAHSTGEKQDPLQGILFTCSAFRPAIDAVKRNSSVPVLRPNESAFREAFDYGARVGLLVSFLPSLAGLSAEITEQAADQNKSIQIIGGHAKGALEALQADDEETHDRIVAETAASMKDIDVLILGQFSLARARVKVQEVVSCPVITTPDAAVRELRRLVSKS